MKKWLIIIALCFILLPMGTYFALKTFSPSHQLPPEASKKILYWIDAMEPQIHYEGPGKSRMNMDLVPVYAEDTANISKEEQTSSIIISPAIINNLGVRISPVEEGYLSPTIQLFGMIKADEDKISHIHSYVEGFIEKIHTKKSQELVEKDQPLFEIYSSDLRLAQKEYLIASNSKDKSINETISLGKLRSLRVSEKQIDELKKTKKDRPLITIYAPQKGYIDSLNIREGMWVKPETTIMSLTDLSEVWVIAEVFPAQLVSIKLDQEVKIFTTQYPNKTWIGKVNYIYPEVDPISLTAKIRISLPNPDLYFKLNMYVVVDVQTNTKKGLKIPKEAVIWGSGGQHVIVALGNGKFQPRKVFTGIEDSVHIEIISGVNKGEEIVTSAQFLIDSEINLKSALQRLDSTSTPHKDSPSGDAP